MGKFICINRAVNPGRVFKQAEFCEARKQLVRALRNTSWQMFALSFSSSIGKVGSVLNSSSSKIKVSSEVKYSVAYFYPLHTHACTRVAVVHPASSTWDPKIQLDSFSLEHLWQRRSYSVSPSERSVGSAQVESRSPYLGSAGVRGG